MGDVIYIASPIFFIDQKNQVLYKNNIIYIKKIKVFIDAFLYN